MSLALAFVWAMGSVVVVVTTAEERAGKSGASAREEVMAHVPGFIALAIVWPACVLLAVGYAAWKAISPSE